MKKEINVQEKLTYNSTVIVEVPDDMPDGDLNKILDKVERANRYDCSFGDVVNDLKEQSEIKVIKKSDSFPDSPSEWEVEILDFDDVKEVSE